jgi:hypothetical protein
VSVRPDVAVRQCQLVFESEGDVKIFINQFAQLPTLLS